MTLLEAFRKAKIKPSQVVTKKQWPARRGSVKIDMATGRKVK
jgi:hypothetical protein